MGYLLPIANGFSTPLFFEWQSHSHSLLNLSGTPAPTPALEKEWHSSSTTFKRVCAPFSTRITKFLESKLPQKLWLD